MKIQRKAVKIFASCKPSGTAILLGPHIHSLLEHGSIHCRECFMGVNYSDILYATGNIIYIFHMGMEFAFFFFFKEYE